MRPGRIHDAFPAPSYRGHQERVLDEIAAAYRDGASIVLIRAPTGSGKSLLARAICGCARTPEEASPHRSTGAYYTTPQVSQLDAVASDPLLDDIAIIRGKRNYDCILPEETDTPVDQAPCARISGYDCRLLHRCPYFANRDLAQQRPIAGMTLAYFMQTAGSGIFGHRDVVVIDEAHGLTDWASMYATIELSSRTVPAWTELDPPSVGSDPADVEPFAERVLARCRAQRDRYTESEELSAADVATRDRLQDRIGELEWFLRDFRDPDSPTSWVVDQRDDDSRALSIKPLDPARFLQRTVWDRGERFALLSATILDKDAFCRSAGVSPDDVRLIDVPHTFPVTNRPLYDVTQGKMTRSHRAETLPSIARTLVRIMAAHPDEKGIVHCHSYAIQRDLRTRLADMGVGGRVMAHSRDDRDATLETWLERSDPAVFLSVTMEEALDLEGELARWQVLCKAPFPNVGDPIVAARLDDGDWAWYYRRTLRTLIQACGRVVRSEDDFGVTYLADSSILDVFERSRGIMPPWFREQVDASREPSLPAFDPGAATGESTVSSSNSRTQTDRPTDEAHPLADVYRDA